MIRYECDKCGVKLTANDQGRYIVKMEVYAAATHIELDPDIDDRHANLDDVLERLKAADPDEVEDQTYRAFRFDVCDACRKVLIAKPLG